MIARRRNTFPPGGQSLRLLYCYVWIADGDLLLFRGRGPLARAVGVGGRSPYSHAAMAAWWGSDLMLLEMALTGGRAVTLQSQVDRWPGRWDWYRALPPLDGSFSRPRAARAMRRYCGRPYGLAGLLRTASYHVPLLRWFCRASLDDCGDGDALRARPHCSQAVAAALRRGGADPVPRLPDWATEPGDLARSSFFEFAGTLVP